MRLRSLLPLLLPLLACTAPRPEIALATSAIVGSPADPAPALSFTQDALTVGLRRSTRPASLASCSPSGNPTLSHGTLLYDFDGDGLLDVYDLNHGQGCDVSGLWLGTGAGFGPNIWSGAVQSAPVHGATLGQGQNMQFIGDVTGDGRVDLYLLEWNGGGMLCANQGNATHSDWSGPSFLCYQGEAAVRFGDVNGDGKLDVQTLDLSSGPYDSYRDTFTRTFPRHWRLNNGSADISTWPAQASDFALAATAAPGALLDVNGDGLPDRIEGIENPSHATSCGQFGGSNGTRLYLGQPGGTYALATAGFESIVDPIPYPDGLADVNGDGCLDVGFDCTGYRSAQDWWVQNKSGATCLATFTHGVDLGYIAGAKRYDVDVDNDGLLDKVSIDLAYFGSPHGVRIYRRATGGALTLLGNLGININGSPATEFYGLSVGWQFGDWNGDGALDFPGAAMPTTANSDAGIALWTSHLTTTNRWIKVRVPALRGFFAGAATIEVFDAGHLGDPARLASAPRVLRTGEVWDAQVHHFGVGVRSSVDVRVTFGDGSTASATSAASNATVTVTATPNQPPVARSAPASASPGVGQSVAFDGSGSSDPDGAIASWAWAFGDGAVAAGAVVAHSWAAPGSYAASLTVIDDRGASATLAIPVTVADATAPTLSLSTLRVTPLAADDVGVTMVSWSIDGTHVSDVVVSPWELAINLAATAPGAHVVTAVARDAAGNTSAAASISFTK